MRFRVALATTFACIGFGTPACADDVAAAARGVVRVIAAAKDNSEPDNSSISFGSGFAISPHRVVTNAHVVEDAENPLVDSVVAVVPAEGSRALEGTIVSYDRARDLAVIDVGTARLEPLAIYSGPVDSGEHAAALGYPGNVDLATAHSVYDLITPTSPVRSEGNVSSDRTINGLPALLHTAAISRGNSGGPLVDDCGRVLGVNTYVTQSGSGDSPFAFAITSQELMSFLRENSEAFQQIGNACVTANEQARREEQGRDTAARMQAAAQERAATQQQQRLDAAKAEIQDQRENHVVGSALLVLFSLALGALATALFVKDRNKTALIVGAAAAFGLAGGAYAFFSRPGLEAMATPATAAATQLTGKLLCQIEPELSRITISSSDDLAMTWDSSGGCMNGRTQYIQEGADWRRVLVPNGSETVLVQDFDPAEGRYVSTRYLLPQSDMARLREIRGDIAGKSCSSDPASLQQLQRVTDDLVRALPATPNEKLVYRCVSG